MTVVPFPTTDPTRFTPPEREKLLRLANRMKPRGWLKTEIRDFPNEHVFYVWFDDAPPGYAISAEGCQRLSVAKRSGCFVLFERGHGEFWRNVLQTQDFDLVLLAMMRMMPRARQWWL